MWISSLCRSGCFVNLTSEYSHMLLGMIETFYIKITIITMGSQFSLHHKQNEVLIFSFSYFSSLMGSPTLTFSKFDSQISKICLFDKVNVIFSLYFCRVHLPQILQYPFTLFKQHLCKEFIFFWKKKKSTYLTVDKSCKIKL